MSKLIQLTLLKVRYSGDTIGDDIRFEIASPAGFFSLEKKIAFGSEVALNAWVGTFQSSATVPITFTVIEQDSVFNDVGSKDSILDVDVNATVPQISTCEVVVRERRGVSLGTREARFLITLQVLVGSTTRYIPLTDEGWFLCKRENKKTPIALPAFLKVRLGRVESGREYFTSLEGALRGIQLWASEKRDSSLQLLFNTPQTDSIQLAYSISKKTLVTSDRTYRTTDSPNAQWKKGLYDIEIPDAPHQGGLNYPDAKLARVWFRIGHSGDRYLHTGRHSLGCITVLEQKQWDTLCQSLLKSRKGDGKSVGVLTVVD